MKKTMKGDIDYLCSLIDKKNKEIERLNNDYLEMKDNFRVANDEIERLQDRIDKAIKLLEEYLGREYVITDEYFEHIIQILKNDYEYVFVGSDKE